MSILNLLTVLLVKLDNFPQVASLLCHIVIVFEPVSSPSKLRAWNARQGMEEQTVEDQNAAIKETHERRCEYSVEESKGFEVAKSSKTVKHHFEIQHKGVPRYGRNMDEASFGRLVHC